MTSQKLKISKKISIPCLFLLFLLIIFLIPKPTHNLSSSHAQQLIITTNSLPEAKLGQEYYSVIEGIDNSTSAARLKISLTSVPYQFGFGPCQQKTPNTVTCPIRGIPQTPDNFRFVVSMTNLDTKQVISKDIFLGIGTASSAALPFPEPLAATLPHIDLEAFKPAFAFIQYDYLINVFSKDPNSQLSLFVNRAPLGIELNNCLSNLDPVLSRNVIQCHLSGRPSLPGIYYLEIIATDTQSNQSKMILPLTVLP